MNNLPDFGGMNLPPVAQIGIVVPDMDAALSMYGPLFGPFSTLDSPMEDVEYRGKPNNCHLLLAFGKSGDVEIELIQLLAGETPHKEFIDQGRSGMHHVRFDVDDLDSYAQQFQDHGYEIIWHKRYNPELAFCYLERQGDPLLVELFQAPAGHVVDTEAAID